MRDVPFTDCIAERRLVLNRGRESSIDVMLEIGRPVPLPQNPSVSACPFRIIGLSREEKMYAAGVDSAQALQLVFQVLPAWLEITAKSHGGVFEIAGGSE
jgi:hypothetical protein